MTRIIMNSVIRPVRFMMLWPTLFMLATGTQAQSPSLTVQGSLMVDAYQTGPFYDNKDQTIQDYVLRSSKLAMKYDVTKTLSSKLQFEYDSEIHDQDTITLDDVVSDAYGDIKIGKSVHLRLGKMKQVASFERNTSSKHLSTLERSMVSSTFFNGRDMGLKLMQHKKAFGWSLGFFEDQDEDTDQQSLQGFVYLTAQPYQLGFTAVKKDLNNELFQLKSSGEINSADNIIRSARFYAKDSLTTALDAIYQTTRWRLHMHYAHINVRQTLGDNFQYQGGFAQLSHSTASLYQYAKGKQKQLKHGWEYVVRISALDLLQKETGSQASIVTAGINYYQSNGLKYMANVLSPQIKGQVSSLDQTGLGIGFRVQYQF